MHKNAEKTTPWKIPVRVSVAARIEARFIDPLTRKPRYAARTRLVNDLLEQWLDDNPSDTDGPALVDELFEESGIAAGEDE